MELGLKILKNKKKFKQIKLAKGLSLKKYSLEPRERAHMVGISSKSYGTKWFVLPKGRAIFKTYDSCKKFNVIRKQRIINERLCYVLAKQVGLPCAEYEPANIDGIDGLVSYDVANKDEIIMTLTEWEFENCFANSIYEVENNLYMSQDKGYKIDVKKFIFDMLKMVVFDTLTMQSDRHNDNVHVLYNEKTKSVRISPLIDNEMAFCAKTLYLSYYGEASEKLFFLDYARFSSFFTIYDERSSDIYKFENNVTSLAKLAAKNEEFKKIVESYIKNMDIKKAIKQVEEDGYTIDNNYKEYICKVHNYAKQMLVEKLNTVKKEDTNEF